MPFKTPDGKEFESRAEWRDYMMATFYSFKNKVDEANPCVKEVTFDLLTFSIITYFPAWKHRWSNV
jgi:hypothetical protein